MCFSGQMHAFIGELAEFRLVSFQLARGTVAYSYIPVQHVEYSLIDLNYNLI